MRDDGYGVIRWKQQKRFGRTAGVDLGNPDLVALAQSFGCRGIRVESAAGLRPALEAALASACRRSSTARSTTPRTTGWRSCRALPPHGQAPPAAPGAR